ncbi:MAG: ATP-binding protein [Synergistaceae bacterium]|nr:ATP-binding protein [Synergistaceae bacterium]
MQILKATELQTEKLTALVYGPPGIGKTTLLGSLKGKTLVIDVDRGTSVLFGNENVDVVRLNEDLSNLPEVLKYLQAKCEYANVCIDTLSELVNGMLTFYGREGNNDGVPSQADYGRVNMKIMDYCRQFRNLPANIVFTAWEEHAEVVAQNGTKFTQTRPQIRDKIVDNVCGLCDIVGQVNVSTKEGHEGERFIRLAGSASVIAKDRIKKRQYCTFEEVI